MASKFTKGVVAADVEYSVRRINKKLEAVEANRNLSPSQKEAERERILKRYAKHLKFLERAVSDAGVVDALAMGAKYAETAGRAVIYGMMAQTLVRDVQALWEWKLAGLFADHQAAIHEIEGPTTETPQETDGEGLKPSVIEEPPCQII